MNKSDNRDIVLTASDNSANTATAISDLDAELRMLEPGTTPGKTDTPSGRPSRSGPSLLLTGPLWLAGAWAVPLITHSLRIDWVLLPLVLALTAGLIRGGRTLLDRFMLAIGLLAGMMCLLGFAGAARPDLMTNVNLAGAALTVLGLVHIFTRRMPQFPRPTMVDAVPVLGASIFTAVMAWPFVGSTATDRVALAMIGEDGARHISAFDGITRAAGYLFWRPASDSPDVPLTMLRYPQGWHFTAATLDRFLPGSGVRSGMATLDHYAFWWIAGFGLFVLTMLWAATWIAGPLIRRKRLWILGTVVLAYVATGDLPGMLIFNAPSEIMGLTLLMMLIALLVRNTMHTRERLVMIAALLIAIGLTYNFLLPIAGVAVLAWIPRNWRGLRQHPVLLAGCVLAVAAAAPVATIVGLIRDDQLVSVITAGGTVYRANRISLLLLVGFIAAAMLSPRGRHSRLWRTYSTIAVAITIPVALLWIYQMVKIGQSTYYFEKALHAVSVTAAIGAGSILLLLPRPKRRVVNRTARYFARNLHMAVLALALLVAAGTVFVKSDYRRSMTSKLENPTRAWVSGLKQSYYTATAGAVVKINEEYPAEPGRMTVVLGTMWGTTYMTTMYLSALQQTSGTTAPIVYHANRRDMDVADAAKAEAVLLSLPGKLRLVAISPDSAAFAQEFVREHPGLDVELVYLRTTTIGCKDSQDNQRPNAPTCP